MKTPILPYALFDMDGTLVDSMGYWREMPLEYLAEVGIKPDAEGLRHLTSARGYGEIIAYFASLGIHTTLPEMLRFVATIRITRSRPPRKWVSASSGSAMHGRRLKRRKYGRVSPSTSTSAKCRGRRTRRTCGKEQNGIVPLDFAGTVCYTIAL